MQDVDWDDLRIFRAVAQAGSFSGAAQALGQHETTIARRIRRLEQVLDHVLWHGPDAGLSDAGAQVLRHVTNMAEAAAQIPVALDGPTGLRGTICLTCVPWLVESALLPIWGHWRQAVPDVTLTVLGRHDSLNLMQGEADIALRFARPDTHGDIVIKKLCEVPFVLAGQGPERIGYVPEMAHLPQAQWSAETPTLRLSDQAAVIRAVHAGLGQAWVPRCVAHGLAQSDAAPRTRPLWLLTHPRARKRAAVDALVQSFLPLVVRHLCS